MRKRLTKQLVESLKPPAKGRRTVYDTTIPAFCVVVTPTGAKSFYVYRRVKGMPKRVFIGRYPDVKVDAARTKADGITGNIADGIDPTAERREERARATLRDVFKLYLADAQRRKRTWQDDQRQFDRYLLPLADRPLADIARSDIRTLHRKIGEGAPVAANRMLALVSTVFNYAVKELELPVDNAASGIRRFPEHSRERFLLPDEMQRFIEALQAETDERARDLILMLLVTGARVGNVRAMRWSEVDLRRGIWHIPRAKSGKSHAVPLATPALSILERRQGNGSDYVFPGPHGGHVKEFRKPWARILARAGIDGLRVHDLRRSLGSWMAGGGINAPIIMQALGHAQLSTAQRYQRLNVDPVRASIETTVRAMLERK